jgi:hypothetical protein
MPLQVIGAGLGRTGTMSLKIALEQLGFRGCYHMSEVIANPAYTGGWIEAADGRPDWERVFAGYAATVDYPACTFWRELAAAYPAAKVVLSVRDPDHWFESTQATIFSAAMSSRLAASPAREFFEKTVWRDFGERIGDREFMTAAFERHNAEVQRSIPSDRLLVYEVAQGWEPLCEFLEAPVPSVPFPRVNSREEMAAMLASVDESNAPMSLEQMSAVVRERMLDRNGG